MQNEKQQELIRKRKEMEQLQDCVEKLKFKVGGRESVEPIIGGGVPDVVGGDDAELNDARVLHKRAELDAGADGGGYL